MDSLRKKPNKYRHESRIAKFISGEVPLDEILPPSKVNRQKHKPTLYDHSRFYSLLKGNNDSSNVVESLISSFVGDDFSNAESMTTFSSRAANRASYKSETVSPKQKMWNRNANQRTTSSTPISEDGNFYPIEEGIDFPNSFSTESQEEFRTESIPVETVKSQSSSLDFVVEKPMIEPLQNTQLLKAKETGREGLQIYTGTPKNTSTDSVDKQCYLKSNSSKSSSRKSRGGSSHSTSLNTSSPKSQRSSSSQNSEIEDVSAALSKGIIDAFEEENDNVHKSNVLEVLKECSSSIQKFVEIYEESKSNVSNDLNQFVMPLLRAKCEDDIDAFLKSVRYIFGYSPSPEKVVKNHESDDSFVQQKSNKSFQGKMEDLKNFSSSSSMSHKSSLTITNPKSKDTSFKQKGSQEVQKATMKDLENFSYSSSRSLESNTLRSTYFDQERAHELQEHAVLNSWKRSLQNIFEFLDFVNINKGTDESATSRNDKNQSPNDKMELQQQVTNNESVTSQSELLNTDIGSHIEKNMEEYPENNSELKASVNVSSIKSDIDSNRGQWLHCCEAAILQPMAVNEIMTNVAATKITVPLMRAPKTEKSQPIFEGDYTLIREPRTITARTHVDVVENLEGYNVVNIKAESRMENSEQYNSRKLYAQLQKYNKFLMSCLKQSQSMLRDKRSNQSEKKLLAELLEKEKCSNRQLMEMLNDEKSRSKRYEEEIKTSVEKERTNSEKLSQILEKEVDRNILQENQMKTIMESVELLQRFHVNSQVIVENLSKKLEEEEELVDDIRRSMESDKLDKLQLSEMLDKEIRRNGQYEEQIKNLTELVMSLQLHQTSFQKTIQELNQKLAEDKTVIENLHKEKNKQAAKDVLLDERLEKVERIQLAVPKMLRMVLEEMQTVDVRTEILQQIFDNLRGMVKNYEHQSSDWLERSTDFFAVTMQLCDQYLMANSNSTLTLDEIDFMSPGFSYLTDNNRRRKRG